MGEDHLSDESTILRFGHLFEANNLRLQILGIVNTTLTAHALLQGVETDVLADSGYRGVEKREEILAKHADVNWHIAMMPGKRMTLDKDTPMGAVLKKLEQTKASIRAKLEYPIRVDQATVLLHQGEVPGSGQEHGQFGDTVRVVTPMACAKPNSEHGPSGMSPPEISQKAMNVGEFAPKMIPDWTMLSSSETSTNNDCLSGGSADVSKNC